VEVHALVVAGSGVLAFLTVALGITRDTIKGIEMLLGLGLLAFLGAARVNRYLRERAARRLSTSADEELHLNS
jgi:multisubunit Na+/H+ antiporter MnhF subunit